MKRTFALILFISAVPSFATSFGLENLTRDQFKDLNREMGANTKHTSVSGASSLSEGKNFEVGFLIGNTQADTLKDLTGEFSSDGQSSLYTLPYTGILGVFNLPKDFIGEVIYLPETGKNGVRTTFGSAALKWTLKNQFALPFDAAIKALGGLSKTEWSQSASGGNIDVDANQLTYGVEAQVSQKYNFAEPYFNLGYLRTTGEVKTSGSSSIFDSSFTSSNNVEESDSALTYALGLNLHLLYMRFGAEIGEAFENRFLRVKVSATF
jgi:hypothetical protein